MITACAPQKGQKKARITARGGAQVQALTTTPAASTQVTKANGATGLWGQILRPSNWSQAQFQGQVQQFLSNLTEPDGSALALGEVSGDAGQPTGIRFWGSVGTNGAFHANGGNSLSVVAQNSALRISVIDSYVGLQNSAGETITEVPIYIASSVQGFVNVSGTVSGNQAQITYQDSYGAIQLSGTFDSSWFQGTVVFQNNNGTSGYLGVFSVSTCGFFTCQ